MTLSESPRKVSHSASTACLLEKIEKQKFQENQSLQWPEVKAIQKKKKEPMSVVSEKAVWSMTYILQIEDSDSGFSAATQVQWTRTMISCFCLSERATKIPVFMRSPEIRGALSSNGDSGTERIFRKLENRLPLIDSLAQAEVLHRDCL